MRLQTQVSGKLLCLHIHTQNRDAVPLADNYDIDHSSRLANHGAAPSRICGPSEDPVRSLTHGNMNYCATIIVSAV